MKKWGLFLGGVVTGVILTFLFAYFYAYGNNGGLSGVTNFDQPGQVINESSVKVMQVVGDNAALVRGQDNDRHDDWYFGAIYLLRNYEGKYYCDDEIIRCPPGKKFRQTGIYKYEAKSGDYKTVAIIEIK